MEHFTFWEHILYGLADLMGCFGGIMALGFVLDQMVKQSPTKEVVVIGKKI